VSKLRDIRLRLLLVEDNPGDALLVRSALEDASLPLVEMIHVKTVHEAIDRLKKGDIDLVLTDLGLPDSYGFDACARLCRNEANVPVVVLSGRSDPVIRQEGLRLGAKDFLDKHKLGREQIVSVLCHADKLQNMGEAPA
jgi:phosphoserine phosphatase RsbU/P